MWHKFDFKRLFLITHVVLGLSLTSCAFWKQEIGGKKHQFGTRPTKIVWLQLSGLSYSHFAFSKMGQSIFEKSLEIEDVTCIGKTWDYNLFNLSPDEFSTAELQLSGSRNDKVKCEEKPFIWKEMERFGFTSGLYVRNQMRSIDNREYIQCIEGEENRVVLWKSEPTKETAKESFHYLEKKKNYFLNYTYQDKGCRNDQCNSEFSKVVISLYENFFKRRDFFFFNVMDLSYRDLVAKKDSVQIQNYLDEVNSIIRFFKNLKDENVLLLISLIDPLEIEIPEKVSDWNNLNKNLNHARKSLQSEVYAFGASSEKFCGVYHGGEIKGKIIQGVESP